MANTSNFSAADQACASVQVVFCQHKMAADACLSAPTLVCMCDAYDLLTRTPTCPISCEPLMHDLA